MPSLTKFINYLTRKYNIEINIDDDVWDRTIELINHANDRSTFLMTDRRDIIDWETIYRKCTLLGVKPPEKNEVG